MEPIGLERMSWQDVEAYLKKDRRIIVPVGSCEQHGRFAPLGTDTLAAVAVAEAASAACGVVTAPPLWYGWSPHHRVRPGTVSIRAEVLIEVLADMIDSLAGAGFQRFVVVNGHRIVNICWMQIAAERVQRTLGVQVALFDLAHMSKEICRQLEFEPIGHGEQIEISHMLHCHPELVRLEQAADHPHASRPLYHIDPRDGRDSLCYVPATVQAMEQLAEQSGDTVTGRPTRATAEAGRRYHEHLVGRLVQVLEQLGP